MSRIDEAFSARFRVWDERCRGSHVFPFPVSPEPPFQPFTPYARAPREALDDGRRPTIASSWIQSVGRRIAGNIETVPEPEEEESPSPTPFESQPLTEIQIFLPRDSDPRRERFEQLLAALTYCDEPFTFEVQGTAQAVLVRLAVVPEYTAAVRGQVQAFFPDVACSETANTLADAWDACGAAETAVVEFGLREPSMRPLASGKFEVFVSLVGALSGIEEGEFGLYQVIFEPVRNNWAESIGIP